MKAPNPYGRREFRGHVMDNATIAACMKMEHVLGYELTVLQGVGGAPASQGAHLGLNGEGGRAVDLAWYDQETKMRVARDVGFAYWPRPELPGVWSEHGHGSLIFVSRANRRGIAPVAFNQIGSFDRGNNGLKGDDKDVYPYRPDPKAVLTQKEYEFIITGGLEAPTPTPVTRMRDSLVLAIHDLQEAIAIGKVVVNRPGVTRELELMRGDRTSLKKRLDDLPKR